MSTIHWSVYYTLLLMSYLHDYCNLGYKDNEHTYVHPFPAYAPGYNIVPYSANFMECKVIFHH